MYAVVYTVLQSQRVVKLSQTGQKNGETKKAVMTSLCLCLFRQLPGQTSEENTINKMCSLTFLDTSF